MGSFQYGALVEQLATTATAAGTTTLTNVSKQNQIFTGSAGQTIVLPNATTMSVGQFFNIFNQSTVALTLQFNGGGSFTDASGAAHGSVPPHTNITVTLQTNGTSAGTWAVAAPATSTPTPLTTQVFRGQAYYTVALSSPATVAAGSIYTSNSAAYSWTVVYSITSSSTLVVYMNNYTGTAPSPTGNLTFVSGTGPGSLSVSTWTANGTYFPTSPNVLYLRVRLVGGGGGGSGSALTSGAAGIGQAGGNSTFTSYLTAGGASTTAQPISNYPGAGGTPSTVATSGLSVLVAANGNGGNISVFHLPDPTDLYYAGGQGGNGTFGGGTGTNAAPGYGASTGGTGAGGFGGPWLTAASSGYSGYGGGAGAYIEAFISGALLASIIASGCTMTVGLGGAGGTAGDGAGASAGTYGDTGAVYIEEYYQ
jgi:hypothetical protein